MSFCYLCRMYNKQEITDIVNKTIENIYFPKDPGTLYQPLEYMMSIGGKRLRPRLCLTTCDVFGRAIDSNVIIPALALEIFHTFTLIHDDIMDKADTRRGMPTVHSKWGDNCAILSGDVMLIMAYQFLAGYSGSHQQDILALFSKTAAEVCEGQQFDMDFEDMVEISMEDYLKMIGLKTAVLIACSAKMGVLMAGASEPVCNALYEFGYQLGMAFQVTDDYLDTFGDASIFGKKIGGDIENNKKSWLLVECMRSAEGADKDTLENLLAISDDMQTKVAGMQALYKKLGVDKNALHTIEYYHDLAILSLSGIDLSDAQKDCLMNFAKEMVYRNY